MGGEYLVRSPKIDLIEGDLIESGSAVISKWPDRAALDAFYTSAEYAPLKAARADLADCHIIVVEDPS